MSQAFHDYSIQDYVDQYADHWGIDSRQVRVTRDGPDKDGIITIRLDSYEHPSCETETYQFSPDGVLIGRPS